MQKVCFSDKEKFSAPPKNRENSAQRSLALSSNSMHRSLRVALQVALENSTQRFPMGRVVGWELSFTEDFVVIPTIDLEIQLFVGLVMIESVLLSLNAGLSRALENSGVSLPLALNGKRDLSLGNVC
ncbi:hypothetical protein LEP1GSC079_3917 [Leptospira interrogans str. FPW1039]|uniref:Uncharacterized protein n=16 Tax=Leptospira interrogans TaxID=173 RepID=A0A0F6IEX6_LEPIR|nr:hypothetical protein LEP1GSC079_3917 [Leptospira interrogans str. FPW1039]